MHARWWLSLACLALLGWQAGKPSAPWNDERTAAEVDSLPLVLLVAAGDRPLALEARSALERAWLELRPNAHCDWREHGDASIGRSSALALCVFAPDGTLVARRDGPLRFAEAMEWLPFALAAAASEEQRRLLAQRDPHASFEHADLALELGDVGTAQREFLALSAGTDEGLSAQSHERLARLALQAGDVAGARAQLMGAQQASSGARHRARSSLTRGLILFAERENLAACRSLAVAARDLSALAERETATAWLALARAQAACGEETCAIATLDELARTSSSHSVALFARELADDLRSPSVPFPH